VSAHSSKLQIGPIPIKNECMTFEFKLPEIIYSYFSTESKDENVLTEGERILTKTWAKKRINDFSTGRFCARTALRNLNLQHHEILIGPKKEPLWPAGIVGSISHSDGMAGAIIACSSNCKSLGLDIENLGRVNPEMWYLLFTEKEQNFLNSLSPLEKDYYSTAFFSMKESFYKFQFPLTHTFLNFTDVEVSPHTAPFGILVLKDFSEKKYLPQNPSFVCEKYDNHLVAVCFDGY
jgi:4'-phosphopantetheinyl transferase EntD